MKVETETITEKSGLAWLDITAEDMARGIAVAETDIPDDEFATWHALMEAAVKPLDMNHGES